MSSFWYEHSDVAKYVTPVTKVEPCCVDQQQTIIYVVHWHIIILLKTVFAYYGDGKQWETLVCQTLLRYLKDRWFLWMLSANARLYLLTYSMEQSPSWEANWFCSSQKFPHILWNPKVHYRTHKCPPPLPILSQLHPVPTTPSHFLKISLNIILQSMSWSHQWSLCLRFPHQNPVHTSPLPHMRHMPRSSRKNGLRYGG